jgi:predicted hotdog family 3-hydroxylacyl-ACP dehydratase
MFDTFGIRLIPAQNDLDYLLHINQALSQNEILLLSADRFTEEARTAEMSFMGMTALFPTAPFRLAVNRSTRMLALFVMREKRLSYKVYVRQLSAEGESKEERVKSLMQKYVEQLEEMVRQYPLQWCNFYEFWEEVVQFPLDQLLPQRPPFVMIDRLTQFSETDTETRFKVRSSNLFVEDGVLSVPGITENIAQTCAARLGYWNLINHRAVDIGFIGAIRNLTVKHYPKVGTRISTHIHIEGTAMGMTLVHAVSRSEKEIVAECDMKIAVQEQSDKEKI